MVPSCSPRSPSVNRDSNLLHFTRHLRFPVLVRSQPADAPPGSGEKGRRSNRARCRHQQARQHRGRACALYGRGTPHSGENRFGLVAVEGGRALCRGRFAKESRQETERHGEAAACAGRVHGAAALRGARRLRRSGKFVAWCPRKRLIRIPGPPPRRLALRERARCAALWHLWGSLFRFVDA